MNMIEDIIQDIRDIKKKMEKNIPLLRLEVNNIIDTKDESVEKVEQMLDILLDYLQFGVGEREFRKLNNYFATFNPENAGLYEKFYRQDKGDKQPDQ